MLRHYLVVAVRNLARHKVAAVINVFGLALAMAAGLFVFAFVRYETSYDAFWPDAGQIYRVVHDRYQDGALSLSTAKSFYGMGRTLKEKLPEVASGTEIFRDIVSVSTPDNRIRDISMFGAEDSFLEVFRLSFLAKKADNPLADLHSAVISESAATKLFGNAHAIGKWFKVNESWEFEVTGVFRDLPASTHLAFDLLLSRNTYFYYFSKRGGSHARADAADEAVFRVTKPVTDWDYGSQGHFAYLLLRPGSDPRLVEWKINQLKADYLKKVTKYGTRVDFFLQPVQEIHLHSARTGEVVANGDYRSMLAAAALGAIILAIAWINFVNMTLARSIERAHEVAVRKVVGASRRDLMFQFLVEHAVVNLLAAALAAALVASTQSLIFGLLDRRADLGPVLRDPRFLLLAGAVLLLGVVASGFYPALVQSSRDVLMLFRPRHKRTARALDPRKLLVVCQFTVSIVLIIGVITVYRQIQFMRRQALGIDIERTLVTYSSMNDIGTGGRVDTLRAYKQRLLALPGVEAVATASAVPGKEIVWHRQDVRKADDPPSTRNDYAYAYVDHDFIPTFRLSLHSGRNFSDNLAAESTSVIVNESAVRQFGFADARVAVDSFVWIGEKQYQVVGVVNDYHQESLRKAIRPVIYFCGYKWLYDVGYYAVKIKSPDVRATVEAIRGIWKETYPLDDFEYRFLDQAFDQQYRSDRQFGTLFALFTMLAVVIAGLGLYGQTAHAIQNRTKEIGIRKVNGATSGQVVLMLAGETVTLVAVAFVVACPLAAAAVNAWLENFAYRTRLAWPTFAAAGIAAFFIAMGTVSYQAYVAATRNPVDALRYE